MNIHPNTSIIYRGLNNYIKGFFIFIILINPVFANDSWNGNGSIISHSTGSTTGYGLTQDVSQVYPNSSNPVVFFQWELNSSDGNKLKIDAENYTSATITYGSWSSSPSEKIAHANVSLPFVLDPSFDGLSNADGSWFTIAVSFSSSPSVTSRVAAEATNENGTNHTGSAAQAIRLSNSNYWGGNGSLISKSSGNQTGFGITEDVAAVKNNLKSSVFFQWEVDSTDGKAVKITSRKGCFKKVKVTTGDWNTRGNDSARTVTLPYTVTTNKPDEDWVLIRVDLVSKSTCDDSVSAEITRNTGGGTLGGEGFYGANAPRALVAVNLVDPVNGPSTTQPTPFVQLQWTDRSEIETGYLVKIYSGNIAIEEFNRPAIAGSGSKGSIVIKDLASGTYSFRVCPVGSALVHCATGGNFRIASGNGNNNPNCKPVITSVGLFGTPPYIHWDYNCGTNPLYFRIFGQCGNSPTGQIGYSNRNGTATILTGNGAPGHTQVCAYFSTGSPVCSNNGASPCSNF